MRSRVAVGTKRRARAHRRARRTLLQVSAWLGIWKGVIARSWWGRRRQARRSGEYGARRRFTDGLRARIIASSSGQCADTR